MVQGCSGEIVTVELKSEVQPVRNTVKLEYPRARWTGNLPWVSLKTNAKSEIYFSVVLLTRNALKSEKEKLFHKNLGS